MLQCQFHQNQQHEFAKNTIVKKVDKTNLSTKKIKIIYLPYNPITKMSQPYLIQPHLIHLRPLYQYFAITNKFRIHKLESLEGIVKIVNAVSCH